MPEISVIVAAQDAGAVLEACLAGLEARIDAPDLEIIVASPANIASQRAARFRGVKCIGAESPASVPVLWTRGIEASNGKLVALTIENCVPEPHWIARMLEAQNQACAAVGGAIEPDPGAGWIDWAVYFCRYSNYMLPFDARFLDDLAADNVCYKRESLEPFMPSAADGFWEALIHAQMRAAGEKLYSDPRMIVRWAGGITARRFLARRFIHARYFAARRSAGFTTGQRLARAVGAPAVPFLLLKRIAGRIRGRRRHGGRFLIALPLVFCFLASWAAGECAGYLAGSRAAARPVD